LIKEGIDMEESSSSKNHELGHTHVVFNGKAELELDQLAAIQPGMARLMAEISPRMSTCWWATKYGNIELAKYQISETAKLLKTSVVVRPKYSQDMTEFIDNHITRLKNLLTENKIEEFFKEFETMVVAINKLHEKYNKGFIVWKVSDSPPENLDLNHS
jgi:hypothetical protein